MKKKITLAIFDLTDCEGCQLELVALREKLLQLSDKVELLEWRLVQNHSDLGQYPQQFDIAIVEGTPLTDEEIGIVKEIRRRAKLVVALGACAALGGVNSILNSEEREAIKDKIYSPEYRLKATDNRPVSAHIKVDMVIPGCPVNRKEAEEVLGKLAHGFTLRPKSYTVCMECKARQNRCLLLDNLPCMGPVTRGGCGAICVSHGIPCYGCWGRLEGTNVEALKNRLSEFMTQGEIDRRFRIFWREEGKLCPKTTSNKN